jgi:serpin B
MKKNLLVILTVFVFSCSNLLNNNDVNRTALEKIPTKIINANNDFSIELFQTLNPQSGDSNMFISPVSVSFALGMTMNGADGNTFEEMKTVLGFGASDLETINQSYATLINELYNASDGVKFNLANSIWFRKGNTLQEVFRALNEDYFHAKIESLDFSEPTAAKNIVNGWVEDQTEEKIKNLVKESDFNAAIMMLINAIYFKAAWKYEFDKNETESGNFRIDEQNIVECDMMSMKGKFKYAQNEDYDVLELPYANENYSMLMIKPKSAGINEFISGFDRQKLNNIIDKLEKDSVNISLPKIDLEYEVELKEILFEMGIRDAMNRLTADFSKMFEAISGGIWISKVRQKSFLKINEEGTEAAAATVVVMGRLSAVTNSHEIYINFNSPYLFLIREKRSNTILFCGKIINPVE